MEKIDSIQFVHPKDLQDGAFAVTSQDILANVPYVAGCGIWFDHHSTEIERVVGKIPFKGDCRLAPSAARVVYDFYGGAKTFPRMEEMMLAVDKADSAQFTTAVSELAPPGTAGSALAIQTALGFLLTGVTILGVGLLEPADATGWRIAFALLAIGPFVGIVAMARLRGRPEAVRMANGHR